MINYTKINRLLKHLIKGVKITISEINGRQKINLTINPRNVLNFDPKASEKLQFFIADPTEHINKVLKHVGKTLNDDVLFELELTTKLSEIDYTDILKSLLNTDDIYFVGYTLGVKETPDYNDEGSFMSFDMVIQLKVKDMMDPIKLLYLDEEVLELIDPHYIIDLRIDFVD